MRLGHITLVHKKGDKRNLKNYRPISLLNVDYKILARIMSNRLNSVIGKIVSPSQTSCIIGRDISDTVASIRDVITMVEHDDMEGFILKIDQEKAFDKVSHKYLFKTLEKFGFGPVFCRWIEIFYTDIFSAVKCNGHVSNYFGIKNSVRQGCPISALLFVISAEPMARAMKANKAIKGIQIRNTDKESLIYQHADDTTLTICDINSVYSAFDEFDKYSLASGAKINKNKSEILCLGNSSLDESILKEIEVSKCNEIIQVLGVFLGNDQNKCDDLNWTGKITNIKKILNMWKQRHLNIQGRATVISSLLLSKLWYVLTVQSIPYWAVQDLKINLLQFLWMKKSCPVRYNTIIGNKRLGGICIPDIYLKSLSFRLKFFKRFIDENCKAFWKDVLVYFLQSVFNMKMKTEYIFLTMPKKKLLKLPKFYQEMFMAWNEIKEYVQFNFEDRDLLQQPLFYNAKITYRDEVLCFHSFIEADIIQLKDIAYEVIPGFLRSSAIKEIILEKCYDVTEEDIEKAYLLIKHSIPFHWFQTIEKGINTKSQSSKTLCIIIFGEKCNPLLTCTTSHFYQLLLNKNFQPPISRLFWESIFDNFDISKFAGITHLKPKSPDMIDLDFRILHNIIYTNKQLKKMRIIDNECCAYCRIVVEDLQHIFFKCSRIKEIISFIMYHIENLLRDMPNNFVNLLNLEKLVLLGFCKETKYVNFYFLNFFLSQARICIYKTRGLFAKTGNDIDTVSYFKRCLENNVNYLFHYYGMCNNLDPINKYVLNNNCLVTKKNDLLQFNW